MSLMQKFIPCLLLSALGVLHASDVRDTQKELITWVETKKAIGQTEAEWKAEKAIVADLIQLLENEQTQLSARIETLAKSSDTTDSRRTELNADKEKLVAASETLQAALPALEAKVYAILPSLPKVLTAELDPLLRRLPDAESKSRLPVSQRLLTVVGILNKIHQFNSGITVETAIRQVGETQAEVTTLYFGLGGAYFANDSGSYAGYGVPGSDGWIWEVDESIAKQVVTLIQAYKGTTEAKFVQLPIKIR